MYLAVLYILLTVPAPAHLQSFDHYTTVAWDGDKLKRHLSKQFSSRQGHLCYGLDNIVQSSPIPFKLQAD